MKTKQGHIIQMSRGDSAIRSSRSGVDHYNNVQVISLSASDVRSLTSGTNTLRVVVSCDSLSTSFQPVSIVITGSFLFDSVVVNDDRSGDEEDIPTPIGGSTLEIVETIIIIVVAAVGIVV